MNHHLWVALLAMAVTAAPAQSPVAPPVKEQVVRLGALPDPVLAIVQSSDGRHVAFIIQEGTKKRVVRDGKMGPPYDDIAKTDITFSPDSKRLVYAARSGAAVLLVVDGVPEQSCDALGTVRFSPDSKHVAWISRRIPDADRR